MRPTICPIQLMLLFCVSALALQQAPASAQTVTINMGQSAQNYVLTGTGASNGVDGSYGNYYNTQGSCVTSGSTTTCDLTGNFTSSTSTFASGTYDFQTVFTGSVSSAVLSQSQYPVGSVEPNRFQYKGFAPSMTMTLKINVTGGGTYAIPLVANQNFAAGLNNINFVYTSSVCGGTSLGSSPCQEDYVGTVVGATYSGTVTGLVAFELPSPPTISPGTGSYSSAQSVTMTAPTSATTIYYTTDGSTPTASSTPYTTPINVSSSETLNAVAIEADGIASPVSSATYTFATSETPTPAPTFYPFAGTYTSTQNVTLSDSVSGAAIYYTTDGSTPTTSSTPYTAPISVSTTETLNAIALATGESTSSVATAAYSIVPNALSQSGDWEWVGGSSTLGTSVLSAPGVYGTLGTPSPSNIPPGRYQPQTWKDSVGNLWMFGGLTNYTIVQNQNDLWELNPATNQWTWQGGVSSIPSGTIGAQDTFGTQGSPSASSVPGGRLGAFTWTDHAGNFWLYGGNGVTNGGQIADYLYSLWKFTPSLNEWTWESGLDLVGYEMTAVYGTMSVSASSNFPGARVSGSTWTDKAGDLWLFGGLGNGAFPATPTAQGNQALNDLWEFNPSTQQWTWVSGSNAVYATCTPGVNGTLGQAAAGNIPSGRSGQVSWADSSGAFWLFGGNGCDSFNQYGTLNDLWKFDPSTGEWTWEAGGTAANQSGVYGTLGVAAAGNTPGSRATATAWTDSAGKFWLFGGSGADSNGQYGQFNDLWMFDPTTNQWTWEGGTASTTGGGPLPGIYGTLGVLAAGNLPGARQGSGAWTDTNGNLWLFGGNGEDSAGNYGSLNDVWEYGPAASTTAVAPTVTVTPASTSITSTSSLSVQVSVSGGSGTPTGSIVLTSGSYTSASTTLSSGAAGVTIPAGSLATGTDTLTVTYTPDAGSASAYTSATGTSTVTVSSPVTAVAPTVTVTPASSSITTSQTLAVTVTVSGTTACLAAQPRLSVMRPQLCGAKTPGTGSIVLSSGSYSSAATTLSTSGSATISIPAGSLATGTDTLTATYTPDANSSSIYTSATGTASVTVTPAVVTAPVAALSPTSLNFTAATGSSSPAQTVTLSNTGNAALSITGITITGTNASSFAETNTCGISVAAGSSCTIAITFTSASAASLTATLTVADNASGSPQTLTLNGTGTTPPTFTLASATPSASITPTTPTATYQLVVTPQNGSFSSPVSFAASGLPSGYTASFSPSTVTPNSSAANTTMTIQAGTTLSAIFKRGSLPTLALLGFLLWPGRRRRRIYLCLFVFCSIAATDALSGCGGGFNFIHASKTYTITVTATGAAETQSTTVQLTVQQ